MKSSPCFLRLSSTGFLTFPSLVKTKFSSPRASHLLGPTSINTGPFPPRNLDPHEGFQPNGKRCKSTAAWSHSRFRTGRIDRLPINSRRGTLSGNHCNNLVSADIYGAMHRQKMDLDDCKPATHCTRPESQYSCVRADELLVIGLITIGLVSLL